MPEERDFQIPPLELMEELHKIQAHLLTIKGILIHQKVITPEIYDRAFEAIHDHTHPLNEAVDWPTFFRDLDLP